MPPASGAEAAEASPARGARTLALPEDASTHGHRIDALLATSHRFDVALAAVMLGWMVLAVWRFRGARRAAADGGTRRSRALVLAVALVTFVVVDGTLFLRSLGYLDEVLWNFEVPARHAGTVRLEVNARQWAWEARYAGEDGRFGTADDVVTWSDVRVPVGVPVWQLKMLIPFAGFFLFLQGLAETLRCVQCLRDGHWAPRLHDVEELEDAIAAEHAAKSATEAR